MSMAMTICGAIRPFSALPFDETPQSQPKPIMNMKKIISLLAAVTTACCCSTASAQFSYSNSMAGATLIYSNAFNGSAVTVASTPPTVANAILGGTNTAVWNVVSNNVAAGYYLFQDGTVGTPLDTSLLPFKPLANYVYTMSALVTVPNMAAGKWINMGFSQFSPTNAAARFGDTSVTGNPWTYLTEGSGADFFFPTRATAIGSALLMPAAGTYTVNLVLDTTAAKWVTAEFVNGTQVATNYPYAANPTITAFGLGQTTLASSSGIRWNYLTLSASPLLLGQQPVSASVSAGSAFTNTVGVSAYQPMYQWYTNNVPIPGATNASLILNPVTSANAGTNYYVIVTNSLGGSVTSAPASLTVYSAPTIAATYPVTQTNPFTLFAGTNFNGTNYPGASPAFSVSVIGQAPLYYQWRTNGVAVGGATNASFTFTNCQAASPTSFACVVTNVGGAITNAWSATYVQEPAALFADTVMAYNPAGFWRLNEGGDDGNGDNGAVATDYAGGNNGLYTNAVFGYASYTNTDPTAASVRFNYAGTPSDVFAVQGIDYSNKANAEFTVQGWVNGLSTQPNGAAIIAKGYNGGEQFALDFTGNKYRFLVRNAGGTASSVTAATGPDGNWHFIAGVCDEVNGTVTLYVDGLQAATSAPITPGSGTFATTTPVTFGARGSTATVFDDLQFSGYLSDLAVYNSALSPIQVASLYSAAGFPTGFTFIPPVPPTNYVYLANTTITIPATIFGQAPIGFYWTNLTTGAIMASGTTNVSGNLNATLSIPNAPASLSGDQLELVVTNAANSTNWFTTLFSPAPPVALDYSSPILYSNFFNGGTWSIGGMPSTAANLLLGGTNATWTDTLGVNDTGRLQANGISATPLGDSWLLPFTPHAGYVYTLTAEVTLSGYPGSWIGLGFAQTILTNATAGRFGDISSYAWDILTAGGTQNLQAFMGPGSTGGAFVNVNNFYPTLPATLTNTIVLDTTGSNWTAAFYVNGALGGVTNYAATPPIGAVGITQNALGAPGDIQWDYFSLTQVAPNGAPPYLLASLPNSVTLAANSSLSIPASAFGSVPIGYYWSNTNTAAILGAGTTNTVAPLNASLSYASVPSSWNGNKLALVVTNAYGTNISLVLLTVTNSAVIPTNNPTVTSVSLVGTNVVITATNGQSGGTYYLLGATNLTIPLSQWFPLATNVISTNATANGFTFTGTNVVHAGVPQQFYILSNTN